MAAAGIARDPVLDASPAFLRHGFEFVSRRCERFGSDAFCTRLLGREVVCALGEEAARVFYGHRLTRRDAVPRSAFSLLQDFGSVATLDGREHRHRKRLFLALAGADDLARLRRLSDEEWLRAGERWRGRDRVVLLRAAEELLCRVALAWSGIPLDDDGVRRRTRELSAMVDGAGSFGARNLRAQLLRRRSERWARGVVRRIREGALDAPQGSAARVLAEHRDLQGRPLEPSVAAVELLDVLRPTVAVARFAVFAAVALHARPELRERLREDDGLVEPFVQEVRRFYPFFPAIGGRVVEPFSWRGRDFRRGSWFLLDLYGTNRDARIWERPHEFRPERFRDRAIGPYELVPQGGGEHETGHRCPGEWMTIELVASASRALARTLVYEVPPQDLAIRPSRLTPRPRSGFVLRPGGGGR